MHIRSSPQKRTVIITFRCQLCFSPSVAPAHVMKQRWRFNFLVSATDPSLVSVATLLNSVSSCRQRDSRRLLESRMRCIFELRSNRAGGIFFYIFASPDRHGRPGSQLPCSSSAVLLRTRRMERKTLLRDCGEAPPGRNSVNLCGNGPDEKSRLYGIRQPTPLQVLVNTI
jgi:hypothetical protein